MTASEMQRLIDKGTLVATGPNEAVCPKTGVKFTMRPDLTAERKAKSK